MTNGECTGCSSREPVSQHPPGSSQPPVVLVLGDVTLSSVLWLARHTCVVQIEVQTEHLFTQIIFKNKFKVQKIKNKKKWKKSSLAFFVWY